MLCLKRKVSRSPGSSKRCRSSLRLSAPRSGCGTPTCKPSCRCSGGETCDSRRAAERLELPDGDFLNLDWVRRGHRRLVILSHGLEGSFDAGYIRGMAAALVAAGWDALAWTFRGCGPEPNRLLRFYHSGETGDLSTIIRHAAVRYEQIALVGFSLGGNLTLKYLGEAPPHPAITSAAAISAPVDLAASARALGPPLEQPPLFAAVSGDLDRQGRSQSLAFPG